MTNLDPWFQRKDAYGESEAAVIATPRHRHVRELVSEEIFAPGEYELAIRHGEAVYSLKITKQGKLVLNK